ncbi:hypothetical protein, partial [Corynebacterium pseudodiphtheriticum]|uniref:hypothetical protein n=1 Tax=Corynebacterium pseudodiphtheriticum TaxID=37637 RepID=UPI00254EF304
LPGSEWDRAFPCRYQPPTQPTRQHTKNNVPVNHTNTAWCVKHCIVDAKHNKNQSLTKNTSQKTGML